MEKNIVKRMVILSALGGAVVAILAFLPIIVKFAIFILLTCISLPIIIFLEFNEGLIVDTVKKSLVLGSISGGVAFSTFAIIYLPVLYFLSLVFSFDYLGGLVLMLKLSGVGLLVIFAGFIAFVSVAFNAFSSLLYYCIKRAVHS